MNVRFFILLALLFGGIKLFAQQDHPCINILEKANAAHEGKNYRLALEILQDAETCDYKNTLLSKRQELQTKIYDAIEEQGIRERRLREEIEKANKVVLNFLLQEIDDLILKLDYNEATSRLKAIATSGLSSIEIMARFQEVAFWFTETGNYERAIGILDTTTLLIGKTKIAELLVSTRRNKSQKLTSLRRVNKEINQERYLFFQKRYYPIMISVKGGTFTLGCDTRWEDYQNCEEAPLITLSDFEIGQTEITFWQYGLFCAATHRKIQDYAPSWGLSGNNPAVNVSWYDAASYNNWLNLKFNQDTTYLFNEKREFIGIRKAISKRFQLPTEAQWEYAARGGQHLSPFTYSGSDSVDMVGWYADNSEIEGVKKTHSVGRKKPNVLGLYDMSGNVWEWCQDWHGGYQDGNALDPVGPQKGEGRILRGGCWDFSPQQCKVALRNYLFPGERDDYYGFRLVRIP